MSQTAKSPFHTITLKRKDPNSNGAVGSNVQVCLDGVPLKSCTYVKIVCKARNLTKVTLELIATAEVEDLPALVEIAPKS